MRLSHESAADSLSAILPGTFRIERATMADYRALAHFHYARGDPATRAGIWRATYSDSGFWSADSGSAFNPKSESQNPKSFGRVVAVAVLSYPVPSHRVRERLLGLTGPRYGAKLAFVNAHIRTISRVIVHPQFRGLGLAAQLVRRACEECPTRYVEAIAAMGEVHPFFERGGMRRRGEGYFLFDRERNPAPT
jgi:GNAT superfamily N-acetyltransferase